MTHPDFVSVTEYLTFNGGTLSEALRKAAAYLEENPLLEDDLPVMSIDHDEDGALVSFTGRGLVGKTFKDLNIGEAPRADLFAPTK